MFDFITVGSATKDVFLFLEKASLKPGVNKHFLEIPFDKKIDVNKVLEFSGGSATNAAASFSSFNKKCSVIAKVGQDENGKFVVSDLNKRDINTDLLSIAKGETPFSNIIVSSNGKMVILVHRGIEKTLSMKDINKDFDSKWLYIGPLPGKDISFLEGILKLANEKNIKVALNPGSTELNLKIKKMEPLLKYVDIISMNDDEARKFVGYSNDIKNISKLLKAVKQTAIITKGEKGSLVASQGTLYMAGTFKAKKINFVGAGDAFFSAFVNAIYENKSIEEAINLGTFNATNVIQEYGAKNGLKGKYPPENMKLKIIKTKIDI